MFAFTVANGLKKNNVLIMEKISTSTQSTRQSVDIKSFRYDN